MEITQTLAIVVAVLSGFGWIAHKLDCLNKLIADLRVDMERHVTHETCSVHRQNCRCFQQLDALEQRLKRFEE